MQLKNNQTIGVVGLGAMGLGMAVNLVRNEFDVLGFDPSESAKFSAAAEGVKSVANVEMVFKEASIIILSLPNAQVVDLTVAKGLSVMGEESKIIVDTSTSEAIISRKLSEQLAKRGQGFLDAPVSGGPSGAISGNLSIMLGGTEENVVLAMPVLEVMASSIQHVGPSGAGNVAKLVNNMLVANHMITTLEALRLAESAGVSAEAALKVINSATGRSAISEIHFPKWVLNRTFNSGFSSGLMRKDLRLARELANEVGITTPMADLASEIWAEAQSGLIDSDDFMLMGDSTIDRLSGNDKETK